MRNVLLYFLVIIVILSGCRKSSVKPQLSTELFKYSEELTSMMRELSLITELLDIDNEKIVIETSIFNMTNKYIAPFVFVELSNYPVEEIRALEKEEIDGYINYIARSRALNEILYKEAVSKGIDVTEKEIDDRVELIAEEDLEGFENMIDKTPFTMDFVRHDSKQIIAIEKYKEKNVLSDSKKRITDDEVKKYYDENPTLSVVKPRAVVRHILKSTENLTDLEKSKKFESIKNIYEQVKIGKDFAELAKLYSDDEGTKNIGGLVGDYIEKGQTVVEFDDAVFRMKDGEISEVITTMYGYHIIRVDKIYPESRKTIEELKPKIIEILNIENQNKAIDEEINRIAKKYKFKPL